MICIYCGDGQQDDGKLNHVGGMQHKGTCETIKDHTRKLGMTELLDKMKFKNK